MKKFILTLTLILGCQVYAFDIVYPKKNNVTINAKSTFFIGSSDKPIKINGQSVPIHESSGFAYVVELKDGENIFNIETEDEKKVFTIYKPIIKSVYIQSPQLKKYDEIKTAYVINDNSPLRTTPVDSGINRIVHLQRNILLNIDGEKDGFYRIILNNEKTAWIAKTNVKLCETQINTTATLKGYDFDETKDYYEFVFHLDKSVPYEISEDNPLSITFYSVQADNDFNDKLASHIKNSTYTKTLPFNQKLIGYSGKYVNNDFVWRIRKPLKINPKKPLKNITVTIDAGHGGHERGAIGCLGDNEKNINLSISKYLQEILKKQGANVVMTRSDDIYVGLKERSDIANYTDSQVFISIHANALPDGFDPNKRSGVGVYYYYNQSKELAGTILASMVDELGLVNDNIHQASFAVLRNTNALSILIETAYIINPEDNSKLITEEFQKECAKAISNGLENYFLNNQK